jgi:hypothetical protein
LLSKVLNHVVPLRFAVDQKVKADLFLETNDSLDLLLDEFFILLLSDLTLVELGTD